MSSGRHDALEWLLHVLRDPLPIEKSYLLAGDPWDDNWRLFNDMFSESKKGEEYLKANHADENLKKKGYPLENGDENVPMQWTQDKDTLFKYAIVRRVNYRYVTYENPDTRHAEIIEYQFMGGVKRLACGDSLRGVLPSAQPGPEGSGCNAYFGRRDYPG